MTAPALVEPPRIDAGAFVRRARLPRHFAEHVQAEIDAGQIELVHRVNTFRNAAREPTAYEALAVTGFLRVLRLGTAVLGLRRNGAIVVRELASPTLAQDLTTTQSRNYASLLTRSFFTRAFEAYERALRVEPLDSWFRAISSQELPSHSPVPCDECESYLRVGHCEDGLEAWAQRYGAYGAPTGAIGRGAAMQLIELLKSSAVWPTACRLSPRGQAGVSIGLLNDVVRTRAAYEMALADAPRLAQLLEITARHILPRVAAAELLDHPHTDIIPRLKAFWRTHGMTEAGWRWLNRIANPCTRNSWWGYLRSLLAGAADVAGWAEVVSELGTRRAVPLPKLLLAVRDLVDPLGARRSPARRPPPHWILRIAVTRAIENRAAFGTGLYTRLRAQAVHIGDWLHFGGGAAIVDVAPPHAGWKWLRERAEVWVTEVARRARAQECGGSRSWPTTWQTPFDVIDDGPLQARCLASQSELEKESATLHHCVASYGERCAAGESLIVSITTGDDRLATAEFTRSTNATWRLTQLARKYNLSVDDPRIHQLVERVAAELSRITNSAHVATNTGPTIQAA